MGEKTELGTSEAARLVKAHPVQLLQLLTSGRLTGRKVDGRWLINRQSLEAWHSARMRRKSRGGPTAAVRALVGPIQGNARKRANRVQGGEKS